jgi:hypothetical protein
MQGTQNVFFNPEPNVFYKVVSVADGNKAFTISPSQELKLQDFSGADNQKFHVFLNAGKYALVSSTNAALHVVNDSAADGASVKLDAGQHKSSFFEVVAVSKGPWTGKACHIKTVAGKTLDIYGGVVANGTDIKQWELHGGDNQCWVITKADGQQPQQPQQGQQGQQVPQQQGQLGEVPAQFTPVANTDYRVVTVLNTSKALTVSK